MGKLDTTSNFLDLFLYAAGESEVPRPFFFWAGMSLLAACVADRIWLEPDRGRRLVPNLYVFLLGPSGSGKEVAISLAGKYATQVPTINLFSGAATSQYLLKHLARKHKVQGGWEYINTKLYFLTEELAMATRPGEQAHDLVTTMTGLYKGAPYPFRKGTVTGDDFLIPNPCINWLAGSTDDWLVKTIGRDAVMGGFTARLVTVRGRRNYAQRYPQMIFPDDLEEVRDHLHARVRAYTEIQGGFRMGPEAHEIHDTWYLERPAPVEETAEPGFNKADEMVLRFATLLALADWDATNDLAEAPEVIQGHHMREAIDIWEGISAAWMPEVIQLASSTQRTSAVDVVRRICSKFGTIDRSALVRKVHAHGLDSDDLDRCLRTLLSQEVVELTRVKGERGPPRTILTWCGEEGG